MLELAGREADGAILNYVTPEDVAKSAAIVRKFGDGKEIAARIYVSPTTDAETVRKVARYSLAPYLSVPTYRKHQEWLGNERYYHAMWKCWGEGDIKGARAALSDEACDRLYIHGTPDECRARIQEYFDAGLDTAIIGLVEEALDPREAVRLLAPGASFAASRRLSEAHQAVAASEATPSEEPSGESRAAAKPIPVRVSGRSSALRMPGRRLADGGHRVDRVHGGGDVGGMDVLVERQVAAFEARERDEVQLRRRLALDLDRPAVARLRPCSG